MVLEGKAQPKLELLRTMSSLVELPTPPWDSLQRPYKSIAQLGRDPARIQVSPHITKIGGPNVAKVGSVN